MKGKTTSAGPFLIFCLKPRKTLRISDIVGLLQGSERPLPKPPPKKKVREGLPGASRPLPAKARKRVENEPKTREKKNGINSHFVDSFSSFFDPRGREAPATPFRTFLRGFLGRGLFDHCRRPTLSQLRITRLLRILDLCQAHQSSRKECGPIKTFQKQQTSRNRENHRVHA